ncbi:uncharacterized protein LOC133527510 [Cydia pomonella]|uniref:uncharacterized protein LOC133527510 n=1 Tax=Cydia pomonella TaxID=82600 RepID=UPI002ADE5047|nr:uncharacterized protein LOC133527510 [Cydia pomonella]
MLNISDFGLEEIIKDLVPSCVLNEITCFVFYDDHPAQSKICDITICTKYGEVKEYYKCEEVSSLFLGSEIQFTKMSILRNSQGHLFYLLAAQNEVIILSRKDKLAVHKKVSNVDYYDINDCACRGEACLKVVLKDDAVPLIFDDNFENLGERAAALSGMYVDDSLPILTQLKRKLSQARYSIQCNEKTQREFMDLRKLTAYAASKKLHPNLDDSMISESYNQVSEQLTLTSKTPSVAVCNKKVVITLYVINNCKKSLHDVAILLHSKQASIVYATHLFQHTTVRLRWKEIHKLQPNTQTAIVAVIDLTELQYSPSRLDFDGVISYKKEGKEFLMPFDPVVLSYCEFTGKQYDVLANEINATSILPVLATTKKLNLTLRIIDNMSGLTLTDIFCHHMAMECVTGVSNAIIHKISPYHVLNGVTVVFEDENAVHTPIAVYVRSHGQVLPLIHYIHEAIPHRIIITPPNLKITATEGSIRKYNEEITEHKEKIDYASYAPSMLRQTAMILDYLDSCIVKMNESKDAKVQSKIGREIDLFAGGLGLFTEFRSELLAKSSKGAKCLKQCEVKPEDSESMVLDTE